MSLSTCTVRSARRIPSQPLECSFSPKRTTSTTRHWKLTTSTSSLPRYASELRDLDLLSAFVIIMETVSQNQTVSCFLSSNLHCPIKYPRLLFLFFTSTHFLTSLLSLSSIHSLPSLHLSTSPIFLQRRIAIDEQRLVLAFETLDVESKGELY